MPDLFPEVTSNPILAGATSLSPYWWAARLAPPGEVVAYKNALLWLEGEQFAGEDELRAQVQAVRAFQEAEAAPPAETPTEGEWRTSKRTPGRQAKAAATPWTVAQIAAALVDKAVDELQRTFRFAGPSLPITDVYSRFQPSQATYPVMIRAVRDALKKLGSPSMRFGVPAKCRYWAETSAGKGNNFNIKVQRPDPSKPNGWSALAQVHVLWE